MIDPGNDTLKRERGTHATRVVLAVLLVLAGLTAAIVTVMARRTG